MTGNTVRRNFSVTKEVDRILNEKSEEWDMSRSEIVVKAVLEYTDHDRTARIEEKVDKILDHVEGGTPHTSESGTPEKEKQPDESETVDDELPAEPLPEDTTSPVKTRANKFYNYLIRENADQSFVHRKDIEDAIKDVWGESDHMVPKYTPKVKKRLNNAGFEKHPRKEMWYFDEDMYENHMMELYEDVERMLEGEPPEYRFTDVDANNEIDYMQVGISQIEEIKNAVVDGGIVDEEDVEDLKNMGQQRLEEQFIRD